MMYKNYDGSSTDDAIDKFIEGPSNEITAHNLKDGVKRKEITAEICKATQQHVKNILMKLPNKDLFALLGFSYLNR